MGIPAVGHLRISLEEQDTDCIVNALGDCGLFYCNGDADYYFEEGHLVYNFECESDGQPCWEWINRQILLAEDVTDNTSETLLKAHIHGETMNHDFGYGYSDRITKRAGEGYLKWEIARLPADLIQLLDGVGAFGLALGSSHGSASFTIERLAQSEPKEVDDYRRFLITGPVRLEVATLEESVVEILLNGENIEYHEFQDSASFWELAIHAVELDDSFFETELLQSHLLSSRDDDRLLTAEALDEYAHGDEATAQVNKFGKLIVPSDALNSCPFSDSEALAISVGRNSIRLRCINDAERDETGGSLLTYRTVVNAHGNHVIHSGYLSMMNILPGDRFRPVYSDDTLELLPIDPE